ncbi:Regulation of nuclear pre-mRNA domain-containing protein 2 [Trichoplax sp. H2]|nr:Regulation of nuclear pre-mRNA domain-containing protein 2 [Trichoplax sp. H2]|eukprot:RDD36562.1 Regulation of nuclear pre-mRNA domain-containing protein 2 [Trichoplax sp. H2]
MAANFDQSTFQDKLNHLTGSQESVQSLSSYILSNVIHVKSVLTTLMRDLKQAKKDRHMILLYLINDVLQHSKRKSTRIYDEFVNVLNDVVTHFRSNSDTAQIRRIKRIFKIWEDRDVVTKACITNLYRILDADQSNNTPGPIEEFKLFTLTESCMKFQNYCQAVGMKEKGASAFDRYTSENVKSVKDRTEGTKYIAKFDEARTRWSDYQSALEEKSKACIQMIKNMNDCNVYHAGELDKVKIIANAYKSLFDRVKKTKLKLDDKVSTLADEPIVSKKPVENDNTQVQDMDLDNSDDERGFHDNTTTASHSTITINPGIPIPPVGRRDIHPIATTHARPPSIIPQAADRSNPSSSTYLTPQSSTNSWPLQRSTSVPPNEPIRYPQNEATPATPTTGMRYDELNNQGQAEPRHANLDSRLFNKQLPLQHGLKTDHTNIDSDKPSDANNSAKNGNTIQQLAKLLSLNNPTVADNQNLPLTDQASQQTADHKDSSITSLFYNLLPSLRSITSQETDSNNSNEHLENRNSHRNEIAQSIGQPGQTKHIGSDAVGEPNLGSQTIPVRNTTSLATGQRRISNIGKGRGSKATFENRSFKPNSPNKHRNNHPPPISAKPAQTDKGTNRMSDVQSIQTVHDVRPAFQPQRSQLFYQADVNQGAQRSANTYRNVRPPSILHETGPVKYDRISPSSETHPPFYGGPPAISDHMQGQLPKVGPSANPWRGNRKRLHGDTADRRLSLPPDEFSDVPVHFGDSRPGHRKRTKSESESSNSGSPQSIPVLQQHKRSPYPHGHSQGPRRSNIHHPRRSMEEDQGRQISVLDPRHPPLHQNRPNIYQGHHK